MRDRILLPLVAAAAAVIAAPALAFFSPSTGAEHTVSSGTLASPTGPGASVTACASGNAASLRVTVTWTPSATSFADGYEISRGPTLVGPWTVRGTAAGQSTSSFVDSGLAFATAYFYVVATTRNLWRSATTAPVAVLTPTPICT